MLVVGGFRPEPYRPHESRKALRIPPPTRLHSGATRSGIAGTEIVLLPFHGEEEGMRNLTILPFTLLALITLLAPTAGAQITGGAIHGTVRNQLGEPVAGAKVTSIHTATNQQRQTVTNDQGVYRIPSLAVGAYDVIVQAGSYQKSSQQVTLQVNEDAGVDVELLAMGAGEQITVSGAVAAITETNSSVLGVVIDNKQ